ncbi:MAG: hypothetical protein R2882_10175 [Gemmatimonadales bacterium]
MPAPAADLALDLVERSWPSPVSARIESGPASRRCSIPWLLERAAVLAIGRWSILEEGLRRTWQSLADVPAMGPPAA